MEGAPRETEPPTDGSRTRLRRGVRSGGPVPVSSFPGARPFPLWTFVVSGVRAECLRQVNDGGTVGRVRLVAFDQLVTRDLVANSRPQHTGTAPVNDVDAPQPGKRSLV